MRPPLCWLILCAAAGATPAAAPPVGARDAHDVVLLHPTRPYRVRFHLRVAGRPFRAGWNQQVGRLFTFLDRDGDGRLSPAEAGRAPDAEQWRQLSVGKEAIDPEKAPEFAALSRGKKFITLDDLQAYYATSTAGPLQAVWSWLPPPDPLAEALWKRLDTDRDGKLSRAELLAARKAVEELDRDDDDAISQEELMGRNISFPTPFGFPGPTHGPARGQMPFLSLVPGSSTEEVKPLLVDRYGPPRARELEAWLRQPPDLALEVPLDVPTRPARKLAGPAEGLRYTSTMRGESLAVGDWVLYLARTSPPDRRGAARNQTALAAFRRLDTDSNGYLDRGEIYRPPFQFVAWMRLADRNLDEKVTVKEFTDFWDLKATIQGHVTFLRVESQSRSLFRLLDQDGDGRLGVREVGQAWGRLQPWQRNGQHDQMSLPTLYRVTLGIGAPRVESGAPPSFGRVPPRGPVWFQKMDRNGDGDVSRKEWLGGREQFEKLDGDGDGLISLEEAARADPRSP
jgi:Ca2+-binding EF-hand superfamily protein